MKKVPHIARTASLLVACSLFLSLVVGNVPAASANPNDVLSMLPETFTFASGAGGWQTDVHIHWDGTFTGLYEDWDMGDIADEYPGGSKYECHFSGAFANITRISAFEYSMTVTGLRAQGTEGEEIIRDGIRVITAAPYGFDRAGEFRLYLPGMQTSDLPEMYLSWIGWPLTRTTADGSASPVLPFYGLYNVGGEQGFYSDEVLDISGAASSTYITGTVTVTQSGSVSLRNRAAEDGNRLARIRTGETSPCVGQSGPGWYKVFYNGYIGYLPSSAVEFTAQGAQASHNGDTLGVILVTSNDFANVRATPDQTGEWLAGISPGVALDYIDIAQNGWYRVVLPSGQAGYVSNKLCTPR